MLEGLNCNLIGCYVPLVSSILCVRSKTPRYFWFFKLPACSANSSKHFHLILRVSLFFFSWECQSEVQTLKEDEEEVKDKDSNTVVPGVMSVIFLSQFTPTVYSISSRPMKPAVPLIPSNTIWNTVKATPCEHESGQNGSQASV